MTETPLTSYAWSISGVGRSGATWTTSGLAGCRKGGIVPLIPTIMEESFKQLTEGRAVFGDPSTCSGPYQIVKLEIVLVPERT